MPTVLAKTDKSRVYHKGTRYLVSMVKDGVFRRVIVAEDRARELEDLPDYYLDSTVDELLDTAKAKGGGDYFEVKI